MDPYPRVNRINRVFGVAEANLNENRPVDMTQNPFRPVALTCEVTAAGPERFIACVTMIELGGEGMKDESVMTTKIELSM